MLVSNVIVEKEQTSFLEDYFQFLLPFKADLWCAVILMFLLCTLALGFIEAAFSLRSGASLREGVPCDGTIAITTGSSTARTPTGPHGQPH